MIYVIGISIAFFLALLLLTKKRKTLADQFLGAWLTVLGLHLLFFYHNSISQAYLYPHLLGLEIPIPLLHGPFLYLYTAALTNPDKLKKYRWVWHFIPTGLIYLYLISFYKLSASQKVSVYAHQGQGYEGFMSILVILISVAGVLYVFFSNQLYQNHRRSGHLTSIEEPNKPNLNWLRSLFFWMGLIWCIILFSGEDQLIFTTVVFFVVFIGYFGIKQEGIFTDKISVEAQNTESVLSENSGESGKKYEKSGLSDEMAEILHRLLTKAMKEAKLFTNPELSLTDLANYLNVHPNSVSQVINTFEEKNFFDYINSLRIEEFKRIAELPENQKFTLLALAYDCGFNSKTSFNRNFKKATGFSPTEYFRAFA